MLFEQDGKPSKRAEVVTVTAATVREECRFMVRRMALPIEPHETSVKAQINKVARRVQLPPRRVKDLWHGYANSIPAHQDRTIRNAYRKWLEDFKSRALANLQQIESEHAQFTQAAADYAASHWDRFSGSGNEVGAMGQSKAG